ncbi:Uncharacterised protein [Streptococcus pneumoniae]|nr:Uncharacterised protein [Streptococcus pneumoniae]COK50726.1 Uncharacterised protein [Streptococcus pneumoniae]
MFRKLSTFFSTTFVPFAYKEYVFLTESATTATVLVTASCLYLPQTEAGLDTRLFLLEEVSRASIPNSPLSLRNTST